MTRASDTILHSAGTLAHLAPAIAVLCLTGAGVLARKWREKAGADWPTVEGHVQFATVREGEGRDHLKYAVLTYSYFLGQYESGEYVRTFVREQAAWEFANAFKDKNVPVHYNPTKPSSSTLLREDLDRLLPPQLDNRFTH